MGQTKILPVPCVPQSTNQRHGGIILWSRGWVRVGGDWALFNLGTLVLGSGQARAWCAVLV